MTGITGSRGLPYPMGTPVVDITLSASRGPASATWVPAEQPWLAWSGTAAAGATQIQNPGEPAPSLGSP